MKRLYVICFIFFLSAAIFGQKKITSVADGNWLSFSTWNTPFSVPLPGDTIIINHHITLDLGFAYATGSLTINAGGSVIEDNTRNFAINGGVFINNGIFEVTNFATYGGTITNNDTMNINTAFYNATDFSNYGIIQQMDSFANNGNFLNDTDAVITVGDFLNVDTMINHGTIIAINCLNTGSFANSGNMFFTDFSNTGSAENNGNINFNDFTNTSLFVNNTSMNCTNDFQNLGYFTNNSIGYITIAFDFLNLDSVSSAKFINEGIVIVGDDWANLDTITGITGNFIVNDSTANWGVMTGSFDFCDSTPPANYPFIDYNFGNIDSTITFCFTTDINNNVTKKSITIYPNPFSTSATLYIDKLPEGKTELAVYDFTGRKVKVFGDISDNQLTITRNNLTDGIYLCVLTVNNLPVGITKIIVR